MSAYLGEDLILVISPPRAGSTMLQRILGSHSQVQTHPEPHILTPLAFQGYFRQIERAAYNHRVAGPALREFVDFLPAGEADYLDACRAYCQVLYGRAREVHGKAFFLDKTPNYADTILPFVAQLLPAARVVVLTRHPLAQLASTANTFHGGDFHKAHALRDCFSGFIPALARFIRNSAMPHFHVRYEDLVAQPEAEVRRLLDFFGLPFEPACVQFGAQPHITKTFGDPKIARHAAPVTDSAQAWVADLLGRPDRERLCRSALASVSDEDLATFGYTRQALWQPLEDARQQTAPPSRMTPALHLHEWRWRAELALKAQLRRPWLRAQASRLQRRLDRLLGPETD